MILELGLALTTGRTDHHRRKIEGDIVEARPPSGGIGRLEAGAYLWVRVEVEADLAQVLVQRRSSENWKNRFYIPLARLRDRWPGGFDLGRLRDPRVIYQPCLPIDADFRFLTAPAPLDAHGLIYDRETGRAV